MTQVAIAILHLPDSRVVFQRRDGNAPRGANKLSFFGGHIKPSEDPYQAIVRELGEETSLDVPSLNLKHLNSFRTYVGY